MKNKLLPFVALALFIFSCNDVEEPSPNSQIEGVYEYVSEGNMGWGDEIFEFVELMEFHSDGTLTGESYTTEVGSDVILGYRGYFSGTYVISEGIVTISYGKSYHMAVEDINYLPKEDLVLSENTDFTAEYGITEDYSELESICSIYAICTGTTSYMRID